MTKKVCKHCGSDKVYKDAWASWDESKNEWVLHSTYDKNEYCETCGDERIIIDVEEN